MCILEMEYDTHTQRRYCNIGRKFDFERRLHSSIAKFCYLADRVFDFLIFSANGPHIIFNNHYTTAGKRSSNEGSENIENSSFEPHCGGAVKTKRSFFALFLMISNLIRSSDMTYGSSGKPGFSFFRTDLSDVLPDQVSDYFHMLYPCLDFAELRTI